MYVCMYAVRTCGLGALFGSAAYGACTDTEIGFIIWLEPWTPLPSPTITSLCCSQNLHLCLSYVQLSVCDVCSC